MTLQEAFDKVWQWFVVERHSISSAPVTGTCKYRSDGNKCAIGVLIPDEVYTTLIEYRTIEDLNNYIKTNTEYAKQISKFSTWFIDNLQPMIKELIELQRCHDSFIDKICKKSDSFNFHMEISLEAFALKYNLSVPTFISE